jgi:hypothetical protein
VRVVTSPTSASASSRVSVSTTVAAPAAAVYELVSDITRYGEWSPENVGGTWLDGATTATVPGAVMRFLTKVATGVPWEKRMTDLESGMRATLDGVRTAAERGRVVSE